MFVTCPSCIGAMPVMRIVYFLMPLFLLLSVVTTTPATAASDSTDNAYTDDYDDNGAETDAISDPLYRVNYAMYVVNDRLYLLILEPVAVRYAQVVPQSLRENVRNFFINARAPVRFVNCLLQGKGAAAWCEAKVFVVNTTVGILGFDAAAQRYLELETTGEDLGQTLATYGIGSGIYLNWPFFGPSNVRDTVGMIGDSFLDPLHYLRTPWRIGLSVYNVENDISLHPGKYQDFKDAALDPYYAFQDLHVQTRNEAISK